jgi:hypothetical protein
MPNFKDLIALAGNDNGKIFVIDESGEVKLVIMNVAEYQKLLLGKLQRQVEDIESINKKIIEAQLQDESIPAGSILSARQQEIRSSTMAPRVDMRSEVIDPSFNFESPAVDIEDL